MIDEWHYNEPFVPLWLSLNTMGLLSLEAKTPATHIPGYSGSTSAEVFRISFGSGYARLADAQATLLPFELFDIKMMGPGGNKPSDVCRGSKYL